MTATDNLIKFILYLLNSLKDFFPLNYIKAGNNCLLIPDMYVFVLTFRGCPPYALDDLNKSKEKGLFVRFMQYSYRLLKFNRPLEGALEKTLKIKT